MPQWVDDKKQYEFHMPNAAKDTRVSLTGVMDASESQRPKIILANHPANEGPSVLDSLVAAECINSLSQRMDIEPKDVDWFTQDSNGHIQSVALDTQIEKTQNPQYSELLRNNEFADQDEAEKAKKYFPDVDVEKLQATQHDIAPEQQEQLDVAFNEAKLNREIFQAIEQDQNVEPGIDKSAHEYDLASESFSR